MARLDSISAGIWQPGSLLTGAVPDATTLANVTLLPAGWWLFGATGSCDIAWVYDFQILDQGGSIISNQTQRRRPAAGNEDFYLPSAIRIPANSQVLLKLVGGVTVVGLQMAIFTQMGSIG